MKTNKQLFEEKYDQLESQVLAVYGMEMNEVNDDSRPLYPHKKELNMFRQIRNVLAHNVDKGPDTDYITINDSMIKELDATYRRIFGYANDIAVKGDDIYRCWDSDRVMDAVKRMRESNYTHVPIIDENGCVIGVFSENTLLKILYDNADEPRIHGYTIFSDIKEYLSKPDDENKMYSFISDNYALDDCAQKFAWYKKFNYRLDLLFITEDGTPRTPLKGLVTAWDVLGR